VQFVHLCRDYRLLLAQFRDLRRQSGDCFRHRTEHITAAVVRRRLAESRGR
jgi:hypothetical protein